METRCKAAIKTAARAAGTVKPLAITFTAGAASMLVVDKGGPKGRLLVVPRGKAPA